MSAALMAAVMAVNVVAGAAVATMLRTAHAHRWWTPVTTRPVATKTVAAQPIEEELMSSRPASIAAVVALAVLGAVLVAGCDRPDDRNPTVPVTATAEVPRPVNTDAAELSGGEDRG